MMSVPTLCLVMDMINDLVHADSPIAQQRYRGPLEAGRVLENTAEALRRARAAGTRVGYVRIGFSPDYRECPPNSGVFSGSRKAGIFKLGTWGTEVHPDLAPQEGDFDIIKHRVSPFYGTTLELILRTHGIGRLVMAGISTTGVVTSGVREGHDRDLDIIVLEDCCAALNDGQHNAALEGFGRMARIDKALSVEFA
jgi:nicotinamidase-related amidase